MPQHRIPSYRLHKPTGQAVVVIRGRSTYLGKFNSPESRVKYDRVIARYLADRSRPDHPVPGNPRPAARPSHDLTVAELVLQYWTFAKTYYVKNGRPTGEIWPLKQALRLLRRHYGDTSAADFGPLALKSLRDAMLALPITRTVKHVDPETGEVRETEKVVRVGLARRTINKQAERVRRCFAWGVSEELVPARVTEALRQVDGLRKGRTPAREAPPVRPVPDEHVDAVLAHVPGAVRAMILVQRLTGCRPHEVVGMRGCDLTVAPGVWEFRPAEHKSEHRADATPGRERVIFLGPKAQAELAPFVAAAAGGFLFSPRRNERDRVRHHGGGGAERPRAAHYSVAGYRQEVGRGCARAGVPRWVPLQLRHTAATAIRRAFGLEASQAVLGHAELGVTQVYAEVDRAAARRVMGEIG